MVATLSEGPSILIGYAWRLQIGVEAPFLALGGELCWPSTALREEIADRLTRPVGRPSQIKVKRFYGDFDYQAASWDKPRRVIAKIEWHLASCSRLSASLSPTCRWIRIG